MSKMQFWIKIQLFCFLKVCPDLWADPEYFFLITLPLSYVPTAAHPALFSFFLSILCSSQNEIEICMYILRMYIGAQVQRHAYAFWQLMSCIFSMPTILTIYSCLCYNSRPGRTYPGANWAKRNVS
jgi:hypothetical protein